MAFLNGDELSGLIGPMVIRRMDNGKVIVQTKPRQYTQSKKTKSTTGLFGFGSKVASRIRAQLASAIGYYDPSMINRFNTPIKAVLNHCYDKITKIFNFEQDSFSRLTDFEFNIKSPLINFLWVKPEMILVENVLKLTIPTFTVGKQLIFPSDTNVCQMTIAITQININQELERQELMYDFEISSDQKNVLSREILFDVENATLCIASLGLYYFKKTGDIKTPYNSKAFNPANIIGAIITPGVYVPTPASTNIHKSTSPEWSRSFSIKF